MGLWQGVSTADSSTVVSAGKSIYISKCVSNDLCGVGLVEFFIFVGVILVVLYILYAKAIQIKNRAFEAASSIEVQLQKRRDLIPNVLTLAKKFMEHEKGLLSELTELRSRAGSVGSGPDALGDELALDSTIGSVLGRFFAVAENYPDLKSQATIVRAQETYEEVEGHIAAARRFYNSAVTDLNNAIETFPMSVFSSMVGAKRLPYFEASAEAAAPVSAEDYL